MRIPGPRTRKGRVIALVVALVVVAAGVGSPVACPAAPPAVDAAADTRSLLVSEDSALFTWFPRR